MEIEYTRKKLNKFESLKPVLKLLESLLVSHGMGAQDAGMVVLEIAERLVTAGYGWDKIIQYQSKVRIKLGKNKFHNILCFRESICLVKS